MEYTEVTVIGHKYGFIANFSNYVGMSNFYGYQNLFENGSR